MHRACDLRGHARGRWENKQGNFAVGTNNTRRHVSVNERVMRSSGGMRYGAAQTNAASHPGVTGDGIPAHSSIKHPHVWVVWTYGTKHRASKDADSRPYYPGVDSCILYRANRALEEHILHTAIQSDSPWYRIRVHTTPTRMMRVGICGTVRCSTN